MVFLYLQSVNVADVAVGVSTTVLTILRGRLEYGVYEVSFFSFVPSRQSFNGHHLDVTFLPQFVVNTFDQKIHLFQLIRQEKIQRKRKTFMSLEP